MRLYELEDASSPYNKLLRQENKERKNDMKHLRKIFSLLLALVMVLGLATTAFAEDSTGATTPAPKTYTIKIHNSAEGHTYKAYQVFKGVYSANPEEGEKGFLSNIDWGTGVTTGIELDEDGNVVNCSGLLKYLRETYSSCASCKTAMDVADVLKADKVENFSLAVASYLATEAGSATAPEDGYYNITVTGDGYYFIMDTTDLTDKNEVATKYIMLVTRQEKMIVNLKGDVPTLKKTVDDTNDTPDGTHNGNNSDSASYDIGDDVPFHLNITIPADVKDYTTYKVEITDTLSRGLTYNGDAKVSKDGTDVTDFFTINSTTNDATGVTTLTITCNDIKNANGVNISGIANLKVDYSAELNSNAVTGGNGNENTAYLKFSNNPYSNTLGRTPDDKVVVFTFKVIINKVTTGDVALPGAAFSLEKKTGTDTWKEVGAVDLNDPANKELSTFTFNGLDNGIYRLTETRTPAGYNSIKPIVFRIWATHDSNNANPGLTDLHGTGEITLTPDLNDGSLTGKVMNKPGNTLPETGGIGTTIFYVVGIILVLGASVLLITKKRMESKR